MPGDAGRLCGTNYPERKSDSNEGTRVAEDVATDPAPSRRRRGWSGAVGLLGEAMLTIGALILLFVAWQVWWVTREATSAAAATVDQLQRQFAAPPAAPPAPGQPSAQPGTTVTNADLAMGQPFGLITVPRFGNGPQPLLQGTATAQLDRGVGHDPTSALPGQTGNFATAGHRDTYSHPYNLIDTLIPGDAVVAEVKDGWAIYRVVDKKIVNPTQVEVYAPVPDRPGVAPTEAWMTLVACEPHWTAQRRWAVHAKLGAWVPRTVQSPTAAAAPQVAEALTPPPGAPKGP